MLRVCTVFQKTLRLLSLLVLVLVFSLLISLAPMEHATFEKIEFSPTIHALLSECLLLLGLHRDTFNPILDEMPTIAHAERYVPETKSYST